MTLSDPYWSRDEVIMERTRERDEARAALRSALESNSSLNKEAEHYKRRELRAYEERGEARAFARRLRRCFSEMGYEGRVRALKDFDALPWAKDD